MDLAYYNHMLPVQFHLMMSDYSAITFPGRLTGEEKAGGFEVSLDHNDLLKAVRKGMRCQVVNDKKRVDGVVRSLRQKENGLTLVCGPVNEY